MEKKLVHPHRRVSQNRPDCKNGNDDSVPQFRAVSHPGHDSYLYYTDCYSFQGGLYVLGHVTNGDLAQCQHDPVGRELPDWLALVDHLKVSRSIQILVIHHPSFNSFYHVP